MRRTASSTSRAGILALALAVLLPAAGLAQSKQDTPSAANKAENTLRQLLLDVRQLGGVSQTNVSTAVSTYGRPNAWESGVTFSVTDKHSMEFGTISYAISPDGRLGVAVRSSDGSCALATLVDGKLQTWAFVDVGRNCTGATALLGPGANVPYIDPYPPAPVTGVTAEPGDGKVTVRWTPNSESDLDFYAVYVDGVERAVVRGASEVTVFGLTNYVTYGFTVVAVDVAGNASTPSAPVTAMPIDLTPPAVPEGLAATVGDTRITLAWSPVPDADLKEYRVFVNGALVATTTNATFTVEGLTNFTEYGFTVSAIDVHGNESAQSGAVLATPRDLTPPGVVQNLVGTAGDGQATLCWTAVTDSDLKEYRIYQDGLLLGSTTDTCSLVPNLANGTTYTFTVTSVDTYDNESAPSTGVQVTPVDRTPPAIPSGLAATAGDSSVTVSWSAVGDSDLAGYVVYVDGAIVATVDRSVTGYVVTSLQNGRTYAFSIASVDAVGNTSNPCAPVNATPRDSTAPSVPGGVSAVGGTRSISVSWTPVDAADLLGYRVYVDGALVAAVPAGTTSFIVQNVAAGTHTVSVSTYDTTGNESAKSPAITVTVTDSVDQWVTAPNLTPGRKSHCTAVDAQGRIYVTGGRTGGGTTYYSDVTSTVRRFDPATGLWTTLASMPTPRAYHACMVAADGKLYVVGGVKLTDRCQISQTACDNQYYYPQIYVKQIDRFDPATNAWSTVTTTGALVEQQDMATAIDAQGRLYLSGGITPKYLIYSQYYTVRPPGGIAYSDQLQRFDPAALKVEQLPVSSTPLYGHEVAISGNKLYTLGGTTAWYYGSCFNSYTPVGHGATYREGCYRNWVRRFDIATGAWSSAPNMIDARMVFASAVDAQGRIYAFGGYGKFTGIFMNAVERFDPATNAWTALPGLPEYYEGAEAIAEPTTGRIFVAGGYGYGYMAEKYKKFVARYDANGMTRLPDLTVGREFFTLNRTPDGKLWAIGGENSGFANAVTGSVEAMQPSP